MKKRYLFSFLSLGLISTSFGQTDCDQGRYATDVYSTIDVTSNILYGNNTSNTGASTDLELDFYEPNGDTSTARPLVIWAHGGSFIGGSKTDGDVVTLSNRLAKKGFVCASINYRLGIAFPFNQTNSTTILHPTGKWTNLTLNILKVSDYGTKKKMAKNT